VLQHNANVHLVTSAEFCVVYMLCKVTSAVIQESVFTIHRVCSLIKVVNQFSVQSSDKGEERSIKAVSEKWFYGKTTNEQ
jgi:hypothetical protein